MGQRLARLSFLSSLASRLCNKSKRKVKWEEGRSSGQNRQIRIGTRGPAVATTSCRQIWLQGQGIQYRNALRRELQRPPAGRYGCKEMLTLYTIPPVPRCNDLLPADMVA